MPPTSWLEPPPGAVGAGLEGGGDVPSEGGGDVSVGRRRSRCRRRRRREGRRHGERIASGEHGDRAHAAGRGGLGRPAATTIVGADGDRRQRRDRFVAPTRQHVHEEESHEQHAEHPTADHQGAPVTRGQRHLRLLPPHPRSAPARSRAPHSGRSCTSPRWPAAAAGSSRSWWSHRSRPPAPG